MKLSVVFASSSNFNTGMCIVDNAFWHYIKNKNKDKDINVQTFSYTDITNPSTYSEQRKNLYGAVDTIANSDRILYWGDFLHMSHYQQRKAQQLASKKAILGLNALKDIQSTLLLANQSTEVMNKAISFGTNQLLDSSRESLKNEHNNHLKRLIQNSKAWLPRDLYSANLAASIKDSSGIKLGCDCALIYWKQKKQVLGPTSTLDISKSKKIKAAIFFGRSTEKFYTIKSITKTLLNKLNADSYWLPWLQSGTKAIGKTKGVADYHPTYSISDLKEPSWLQEFDIIITDTYHLAVSGWAAGIPAICIANTNGRARSSGGKLNNKDKRYFFFMQHSLLDFLIDPSEMSNPITKSEKIKNLMWALTNKEIIKNANEQLNFSVNHALRNLDTAME